MFPHKTLTSQYIIFMSLYILLYHLPRSPHAAKILHNISQEENLSIQIVHIKLSCAFFIISQVFVATLFQGEHSPLLSHDLGHFFLINAQSIVHRSGILMRFCKLEVYLVFSSEWKWFYPKDRLGHPRKSERNSYCWFWCF